MRPKQTRSCENADPKELYNPVPRVFLDLIIGLVAWAIFIFSMPIPLGLRR